MKRFEDVPNRREPWSLYLQTQLWNHCEKEPLDSFAQSVKNFYGNSCYSRNCCVEVFQKGTNHIGTVQMKDRGDPYAFCIGYIVFFRQNGRTVVPHHLAVRDRSHVHFIKKCYRWQKNGNHGKKKTCSEHRPPVFVSSQRLVGYSQNISPPRRPNRNRPTPGHLQV